MGKYLITGRQGSGKTTVIEELQRRGFTAYNTDDLPDATKLQNIETGETIEWPKDAVDWRAYAWNWQDDALKRLLDSDETVFIGAVTSNQENFYPLFDRIFALIVSTENLRARLSNHEHDSHHLPGQIERLTDQHEIKQQRFKKDGAIEIDANRPYEVVVDRILAHLDKKT